MKEKKPVRGGRREGSGRPAGSGKTGEPTKLIRVPEGAQAQVLDFIAAHKSRQAGEPTQPPPGPELQYPADVRFPAVDAPAFDLPLYAYAVPAGLPAAAEDTIDRRLDLNQFLIRNPAFAGMTIKASVSGAG